MGWVARTKEKTEEEGREVESRRGLACVIERMRGKERRER